MEGPVRSVFGSLPDESRSHLRWSGGAATPSTAPHGSCRTIAFPAVTVARTAVSLNDVIGRLPPGAPPVVGDVRSAVADHIMQNHARPGRGRGGPPPVRTAGPRPYLVACLDRAPPPAKSSQESSVHPTPRLTLVALIAAFVMAASAGPASAQRSGGATPAGGDWSLMFTLFEPDALTHFGVFRMVGDRMNLGLEAEFTWADGDQEVEQVESGILIRSEGTTWDLLIGPSLRWYGDRIGPVSPYLRSRLSVGWGGSELFVNDERQRHSDSFAMQASVGVGAEWYPISRLGVGGHTGVSFTRNRTKDMNEQNGSQAESITRNVRTFRSGLVVNFYFR